MAESARPKRATRSPVGVAFAIVGICILFIVGVMGAYQLKRSKPSKKPAPVVSHERARAAIADDETDDAGAPVVPARAAQPAPTPADGGAARPTGGSGLFDQPAPELIAKGWEFVQGGKPMRSSKIMEIAEYAKSNPRDARPHLILAHEYLNRGWRTFAISHYRQAFEADPRAKDEPGTLDILLTLGGGAPDEVERGKAAAAIQQIFGDDGVAAVEQRKTSAEAAGNAATADRYRLLGEAMKK